MEDITILYQHCQNLIKTIDKTHPLQSHHYMTIEDIDFRGNILDIGSGYGEFAIVAKLMKPEIKMTCVDSHPFISILGKMLSVKANAKVDFITRTIGTPNDKFFKPNSFDCVVLSHVVEHIKDIDTLFESINRILKKDGIIYLSFPHANAHDSPEHVHYFCSEDDMAVESNYNGIHKCINIDSYLKKFNYESEILLFDEELADKRHPYKSRGQLDYFIKIKYRGKK